MSLNVSQYESTKMSNDIYIWKSNEKFTKDHAQDIHGQLAEGDSKPDQIDSTDVFNDVVSSITNIYPSLDDDPKAVWASSFFCSDWHCTVSISYDGDRSVDAMLELQSLCEQHGLTLYDTGAGTVFP